MLDSIVTFRRLTPRPVPRNLSFLTLCLVMLSGVAYAQEDITHHSEAKLISQYASIEPGKDFRLALRLELEEGWHTYWRNPGDSGEAIEIIWDLPDGFEAGPIEWLAPLRIDEGPLRSYGYSHPSPIFISELSAPTNLTPGTSVTIAATAYWLICKEICIPLEKNLSLTLPVRDKRPASSRNVEVFSIVREALPLPPPADWSFQATSTTEGYLLRVTPPTQIDPEGAYFFPYDPTTLNHSAPQPIRRDSNAFLITLKRSSYATGTAKRLQGVLVAEESKMWTSYTQSLKIDVPVQEVSKGVTTPPLSFPLLLLLACIGGLLLNLMPCVFPILSIKVLGFATQEKNHGRHGIVFAMGVILSFWILAGLLLVLRAASHEIGWGFQLQSPLFVAGMALLFVGIGLNLLGVFDIATFSIGSSTPRKDGYLQSFYSGVLATLVATPCTAPFMGAAIGAAIVMPTLHALLIFTALAVGMAIPYVVLSMLPGLQKRLPKPGAWMETIRHLLAFPMLATAIWLAWVFGKQTGIDGVALLLLGFLLLGIALWMLGRWPIVQISKAVRLVTRSIAVLVMILSLVSAYAGTTFHVSGEVSSNTAWQPFSQEKITELRAEGKAAFVDFTAAWCLTCQVNKQTTLGSTTVQNAFQEKGVVLFRADWTTRDDNITRALKEHGRNGVPLYVLYHSGSETPILLPEVLTESIILQALEPIPYSPIASTQPFNGNKP